MLTDDKPDKPETPAQPDAENGGGDDKTGIDTGKLLQLTQEQFDKLMGDRATRAADATRKKFLDDLGVTNPEELKVLVDAEKKRKESDMTELQKVTQKLSTTQEAAANAAAERDGLIIENAVIKAAMTYDPPIPSDRIPALLKLIDGNTLSVKEGEVSGSKEAIKAVLEANPFLLFTDGKGTQLGTPTPRQGIKKPALKADEGREKSNYPPA